MNTFVTIGFRKKGGSEILATPDVSYDKQKTLFKTFESDDFSEIELWSRAMGKIKSRKVRAAAKNAVEKKTEDKPAVEKPNKSAKNAEKKEK